MMRPPATQRKRKKKKKKNKKKKDGTLLSDQDQSQSDLSHVSLGDNQGQKTKSDRESSDSESSDAMDVTPDSLQDAPSSLDSQSGSIAANPPAPASEGTQVIQGETTAARVEAKSSEETPHNTDEGERNAPKSPQDQTLNTAPTDSPTQQPVPAESKSTTSQSDAGKGAKATNAKEQKTVKKNSKNQKDIADTQQPALDQNANEEPNVKQTGQTKQKAKNQQDQRQKQTSAAERKAVGGSQTPTKTDSTGSSVDPQGTVEPTVVQPSGSGQKSTAAQTSDTDKGSKDDNKDNKESSTSAAPPPQRVTRSKSIAAHDRLTIYFHAVLSKDFKFVPNEDRIFIRAGPPFGKWDENVIELFATRDLGEHGFLVEGSLPATKKEAESVSIPYKYVVYKQKKKEYEYEYIYKLDSTHYTTNRCLFVKSHILSDNGDWHQYDDIICAEPSKGMLKRIKETLWPEQKKSLIQGREIAGNIMLKGIFDLLRSWTDVNLRSFLSQLDQFFQVYGNPFVYEERQKKWYSLDYGEDDVRRMLKEFMMTKVIPQLLKDEDRKMLYVQDPMKAAVIMLHVWRRYQLKLDNGELHKLCYVLCLPKLDKENFLKYWAEFSQDVAILKISQKSCYI